MSVDLEEVANDLAAAVSFLMDWVGPPGRQNIQASGAHDALARWEEVADPWVCEKCGQLLGRPARLCNSGIHVGPSDGEEAQGEAVRLSDSRFDHVVFP